MLLENQSDYLIYVKKKNFKLFVINRDIEIVQVFDIAVGKKRSFYSKLYAGDNGTPEGFYHITELFSLNADRSTENYKHVIRMNARYFTAEDAHYLWGYPEKDNAKQLRYPARVLGHDRIAVRN